MSIFMGLALLLLLPGMSLRAQQAGSVTINFTNEGNLPIQLSRIPITVAGQPATSFQGGAVPLGTIPAGGKVAISSLPGDVWIATVGNQIISQYQATAEPQQVVAFSQAQVGAAAVIQPGSKIDNFLQKANRFLNQVSPPDTVPPAGMVPSQGGGGTPPPIPAPVNPAATGTPASVTLTNVSPTTITVYFINQQNQLQSVGEIPSNMAAPLSSRSGQRLVFLDPSNQSVGAYTVTGDPAQTYTIGKVGGNTGSTQPAENAPTMGNTFTPVNPPAGSTTNNSAPNPVPHAPPQPGNNHDHHGRAQIPGGTTGSKVSLQEAQALVEYHNEKRREVGSPPLRWSAEIAEYAQARAETIARTKQFSHLPYGQNPYGENLASAASTGGVHQFTAKNGAEDWYKEKQQMPQGATILTREVFSRGVGHYTQMVWKDSTEIGAGTATYQQNGYTMTVIVCCYNPPGNVLNQPIF